MLISYGFIAVEKIPLFNIDHNLKPWSMVATSIAKSLRVSPTVLKSLAVLKFYWTQRRRSTELAWSQSLVSHTL
jgi:hypothetical protein